MRNLIPHLEILPESQRQIWERLGSTPADFVLYGGTALALRLGHRQSIDFDFFSPRSFQPLELARSVGYLRDQTVTQQSENTLSCEVDSAGGSVKISFFGGLSLGQIEPPDRVTSNNIAVASPLPDNVKADLRAAVRAVSLPDLPAVIASQKVGEGT